MTSGDSEPGCLPGALASGPRQPTHSGSGSQPPGISRVSLTLRGPCIHSSDLMMVTHYQGHNDIRNLHPTQRTPTSKSSRNGRQMIKPAQRGKQWVAQMTPFAG